MQKHLEAACRVFIAHDVYRSCRTGLCGGGAIEAARVGVAPCKQPVEFYSQFKNYENIQYRCTLTAPYTPCPSFFFSRRPSEHLRNLRKTNKQCVLTLSYLLICDSGWLYCIETDHDGNRSVIQRGLGDAQCFFLLFNKHAHTHTHRIQEKHYHAGKVLRIQSRVKDVLKVIWHTIQIV